MTDDKKVGEELLKQNGIERDALSDDERSKVRLILARDRGRVKRLKWVVAISWATAFVGYLLMIPAAFWLTEHAGPTGTTFSAATVLCLLMLLAGVSLITAIVCTISLVIRARSLNSREIKVGLDEIAARLEELAQGQRETGAKVKDELDDQL